MTRTSSVKALLRVAVVCSILLACNRATADLVIPPPLRLKLAAGRAIRGIETHLISPLIMGSPTRRLINPTTRCWAKIHKGANSSRRSQRGRGPRAGARWAAGPGHRL